MKRYLAVTAISITTLLLSGCATTKNSNQAEAKKSVITMVNAIDKKDWQVALKQFDDNVFVDYSSMTGQPGKDTKSKDLVSGWQKLLSKAETHHMLTNFEVSGSGQSAEVFSHVYASHTAKGVKYWDIYGRYHHKLKKTAIGWKITHMKLIVHGQKGNKNFLTDVSR